MTKNLINYDSLTYLKTLISPDVKIMDVYVMNKWLVAVLSSNMRLMVKNNPIK